LSDNPEQYLDAALQGIKELLKQDVSLSINEISTVKMGTTVGTNALLGDSMLFDKICECLVIQGV
ncbi:MAG: hypothetical protein HOM15_07445, partial [Gammaproteobacteria bacterium]|nr:hypothetical protein [Gammaproteobacteria bacterium]